MTTSKKPLLLCILDGWGIGDVQDQNNAIARANTPNYDRFFAQYPHSQLMTSGLDVGLPEGQIGNSEVGHMTIGAGRVIFQDLPRINNAIADGSLASNVVLNQLVVDLKASGKSLHLAGLLSDGGVHSHIDHVIFLANFFAQKGVKVLLHVFLDGRDVAQKSALKFLQEFHSSQISYPSPNLLAEDDRCGSSSGRSKPTRGEWVVRIATVSGRYYAMDRDNRWDRVQLAYEAVANAKGEKFSDAISAIRNSYAQDITDEFVKPCVIGDYSGVASGDALLFCNFRADRARQISAAFLDPNFKEFATYQARFSKALALTEYSEHLNKFYQILFPSQEIKNSLPEILSARNLTQLRIAETEKYAHVTFFFSCGREKELPGEERILVASPKIATYDMQPEMSARSIGSRLREAINSQKFDFIIVNYANPDMVGHSGKLEASIKACEVIDEELGLLEKEILAQNGLMLISADHGNIECMRDEDNQPHTSHTTNPVPLILISNDVSDIKLKNGSLADIAPTVLAMMGIKQPEEMTGKNLISSKNQA